jgi:hypothetical protein
MIHTEEHEKKEKHGMYVTYGTMEQQHIYIYIFILYIWNSKSESVTNLSLKTAPSHGWWSSPRQPELSMSWRIVAPQETVTKLTGRCWYVGRLKSFTPWRIGWHRIKGEKQSSELMMTFIIYIYISCTGIFPHIKIRFTMIWTKY